MTPRPLPLVAALAAASLAVPATAVAADAPGATPTLLGRAALPAATFAPGPPSGQHLRPPFGAGVTVPFASQPVQGFSAVVPVGGAGDLLALPDNGYGALENSADFNLRVYRIHPTFKTVTQGSGRVQVKSYVQLRDPDAKVPFTITNAFTKARVLTGADFDPESLQVDQRDGTLWIGEEFGPYLLHADRSGRILDAPFALPDRDHPGQDIRSPQSPESEESTPQRILNALDARGRARGATQAPVASMDSDLIADGDPATTSPDRDAPLSNYDGTTVPAASSEIFDVAKLHAAGYKVVPYTVNDPARMAQLIKPTIKGIEGVDGLISDRSDLLYEQIKLNRPDAILPDGRVDPAKFDFQGHRGSRNLRPENTLPAMEAGLGNLVNTLETDNAITKDGVPVLDHEPYVSSVRCRRADGQPYGPQDEVLVKSLTFAELQDRFTCDNVFRGAPQSNDRALSPVAVAFAQEEGLRDPYVMPSTQQLFDFVDFYAEYFSTGAGKSSPGAAVKAANAEAVRFNIETKINPRTDRDEQGTRYADRTVGVNAFADAVTGVIERNDLEDRAFLQSFDFRTLLRAQDTHPEIALVTLWGDTPRRGTPDKGVLDYDGTNLQPGPGQDDSPWLAGLHWPYRSTVRSTPFRAQASGGFEGMAQKPGGRLLPMLEKTLAGDPAGTTLISEFNPRTQRWTSRTWRYRFDAAGVSIGDFQVADNQHGLVLERDGGQGLTAKFKTVEEIRLGAGDGHVVTKEPIADELAIRDPFSISSPFFTNQPGDLLVGKAFGLPFSTIESLQILDRKRVLIGVDNNYPFSVGRHVGTGKPDDDEFVVLGLPRRVG